MIEKSPFWRLFVIVSNMKNVSYPIWAGISVIAVILTFIQIPSQLVTAVFKTGTFSGEFILSVVFTVVSLILTFYFRSRVMPIEEPEVDPTSSRVYKSIAICLLCAVLLFVIYSTWASF
jgi:hypothetical protein